MGERQKGAVYLLRAIPFRQLSEYPGALSRSVRCGGRRCQGFVAIPFDQVQVVGIFQTFDVIPYSQVSEHPVHYPVRSGADERR